MDYEEPTQATQNTQGQMDPRRMGRNNSGLSDSDISDVICILHPCSPAAFRIVASAAALAPRNVLQNDGFGDYLTRDDMLEQETFILSENASNQAMDLALRFSTQLKNPALGFLFGRNLISCDIVLDTDTFKRVSNAHFAITVNSSGVLMLQDMSTNGTIVDEHLLRGKLSDVQHQRMLNPGSVIQILSPKADDIVKFIVRIPSREGHFPAYEQKFHAYMRRAAMTDAQEQRNRMINREAAQAQALQPTPSVVAPLAQNQFGMHWSGGTKYNVVALIGRGAFATVFQLATKSEGQLYAAKELEKRRFMKNGVLDRKMGNEMEIMKSVDHPNIVQFVEHVDHINHMYIIMEFVPYGDLSRYISGQVPMREDLGRTMAAQVLDALTYLHRKKITHRDIKPDNILIANADPEKFTVKLSDFGLSKMVQNNETFLKTFCGTLLYCAPEVFPHYDAYVTNRGKKRSRAPGIADQPSKFHSYSQSVDIWSFGAVLWYSLCLKPPFEGVAGSTGRPMFEKIMKTSLDTSDLKAHRVSDDAIDLLLTMLNTDPASRPTPTSCLTHPWFADTKLTQSSAIVTSPHLALGAIVEEDEIVDEADVAGLSLDERDGEEDDQSCEVSIHSGSLDFFDPRQSKRVKSEAPPHRDTESMVDAPPDIFYQSIPIAHKPNPSVAPETAAAAHAATADSPPIRRKLFGEISRSALHRPVLLERKSSEALADNAGLGDGASSQQVESFNESPLAQQRSIASGAMASPSLLGAESMVRELNMDSPRSAHSLGTEQDEPMTPKTPGFVNEGRNRHSQRNPSHDEVTPKQAARLPFSRRINIPIPASFYYQADDPSTHTLEYATKVSGHDYTSNGSYMGAATSEVSLPTTASVSENENEPPRDPASAISTTKPPSQTSETTPTLLQTSHFLKPAPRLGRLISTPDSFITLTLNLNDRLFMWGRDPSNTHVYADKSDTRVPKRGIFIIFHADGIDDLDPDDDAWTKFPDLHCVISTESSKGIYINGVLLKNPEPGKRAYGRVHTGDEIIVSGGRDARLRFVCEFSHGEGRVPRPEGETFRVEVERDGSAGAAKIKGKGKGKENERVKQIA